MKRFLKLFAVFTVLYSTVSLFGWIKNDLINPYSDRNVEVTLARDLPKGTSKARVVAWLTQNGFAVYYQRNDVLGRRDNIYNDFIVTTDLMIRFSFDEKKALRSFQAQELYTGP